MKVCFATWMVAAMSAFLSCAEEVRVCRFVGADGKASDLPMRNWTATLNGKPIGLLRGEHRCGRYVFADGWIFHGIDPSTQNVAVIRGEFHAPSDGKIEMGLTGDWFYDIELDGRRFFTTATDGNGSCEYGLWNRSATCPVSKGAHELTVRLVNGLGKMMFALGKPVSAPVRSNRKISVDEAIEAARRIWTMDSMQRTAPARLKELDRLQMAVDMTSGEAYKRFFDNGPDTDLFNEAPALAVINAGIDRILADVPKATVKPGSIAVWYVYDIGHIVKTAGGTVFGIDVSAPRDDELAELCDFALVTHNHEDHASLRFLKAMQRKGGFSRGKPVVSAFLYTPYCARRPQTYWFGDCTVETGISDHNPFWRDSMTPYKITCGSGKDAVSILHHGDGHDASQIAHFAPVDIAIVHVWPWDGHNGENTAKALKPDLLVLSHAQELTHGFGPGRWSWRDCESEALRATDAKHVICPIWGERFNYTR